MTRLVVPCRVEPSGIWAIPKIPYKSTVW